MSILEQFRHELLTNISEDSNSINLIRLHDKNLSKNGELSFPVLGNTKVWKDCKVVDLNAVVNTVKNVRIKSFVEGDKNVHVWLDRKHTIKSYFESDTAFKESQKVNTDAEDDTCEGCDDRDLTSERAVLYSRMMQECKKRVGLRQDDKCVFGTKSLESSGNDKFVQVGPVLGEDGKKCSLTVQQFARKVRDHLESQDSERRDEEEDETDRQDRLDALTLAQVNLMLTSSAPSSQVKLDHTSRDAVFILYNCARIVQMLHTFQQNVQDGFYPELPDDVDWSLLETEEEWTIFFVYILPYTDVLSDAVNNLRLHRIPIHLKGLSTSLSRYYSRVKVLRDPLPSILPTMFTRIKFLHHVLYIITDGLHIMGLKPLNKM